MKGFGITVLTLATLCIFGLGGTAHAFAGPELDPGTAASGLALLAGGLLFLIERRRR
jgi:hypothetical protein